MRLGIIGLPNIGKSTLFNAITKVGAQAANYPFCTIEPNVGMVTVPDERLEVVRKIYGSKEVIPTTIEFVDIAGLVKGASRGEGLGNKFLANIHEVDAIIHVVRCFECTDIVHVDGNINPVRDIETINLELIFADIDNVDRQIERTQRAAKSGDPDLKKELELLKYIKASLEEGIAVRNMSFDNSQVPFVRQLFLLTSKPIIYVANILEADIDKDNMPLVNDLVESVKGEETQVLKICAGLEEEIAELEDDEKASFLWELGIGESSLDKLIKSSYSLLNLISFITTRPQDVRAWTIKKGTKAPEAAGKIHTDFEKGFIRAETIAYEDLVKAGSNAAAREKGLVRLEGKDYKVQDGDVILFRFNV